MSKSKKVLLFILLILNAVVLLGQLWPEGAPPFAKKINIVFLTASLMFYLFMLIKPLKNK